MHHYSVLMSVYGKEKAEYLSQAMESMLAQTVRPSDFVLVCDGPLTPELDAVIVDYEKREPELLQVVRLQENRGLGNALNVGLEYCKHDLIARMDSDDISMPNRCEVQTALFAENPELSVSSATVQEFQNTVDEAVGCRKLPLTHREICTFSKKRSPFNHPAVMFRKAAVKAVGGYRSCYPYFEDYDLWVRMLQAGYMGRNVDEPLLYMRADKSLYHRRRGFRYAGYMLRFHKNLRKSGWTTWADYLTGALPHAILGLLPVTVTKQVYRKLHR